MSPALIESALLDIDSYVSLSIPLACCIMRKRLVYCGTSAYATKYCGAALTLKEDDLAWLKREVSMLTDIFKESPAYEWMTENVREEEREKARKQIEEERQRAAEQQQRAVVRYREAIVEVVLQRFPALVRVAQKQMQLSQNTDRLQRLLIDLCIAQNVADAEHLLLYFGDEESESTPH